MLVLFLVSKTFPLYSPKQDLITITGYEKNAEGARDAILKIVADLEEMVSEDVRLDHRVHARIIGGRGKAIRKLMEEFRVSIGPTCRGNCLRSKISDGTSGPSIGKGILGNEASGSWRCCVTCPVPHPLPRMASNRLAIP